MPIRPFTFIMAIAGAILLMGPAPDARAETSTHYCAAGVNEPERTYCPLPESVRSVQLAEQISQFPCIYGDTWGLRGTHIWTARGCAAQFTAESSDYEGPHRMSPPFGYEDGIFRREA